MNTEQPNDALDAFGACPACGRSDGVVNVFRESYGICFEHKLFWRIGSNLFPDWRDEPMEVWIKNYQILSDFGELESPPHFPDKVDGLKPPFGGGFSEK